MPKSFMEKEKKRREEKERDMKERRDIYRDLNIHIMSQNQRIINWYHDRKSTSVTK